MARSWGAWSSMICLMARTWRWRKAEPGWREMPVGVPRESTSPAPRVSLPSAAGAGSAERVELPLPRVRPRDVAERRRHGERARDAVVDDAAAREGRHRLLDGLV